MKLTLQVTKRENKNMSSLVKQMCSLKCRINVDSLNGKISIVDMDDDNVESVIDAINEAFDIIGVDIVPTVVIPEPEPPVVTEDSIEFEKLEFNNAEVREQANKLLRVIYWAMYSNNAKSRDICKYLMTTGAEIAMKYNPKEPTEVSIGDVVDCNYGSHLKGEITGGHVNSIVCDIDNDGMVYVLPITKATIEGDETRFLPFSANLDVEYTDTRYTGGTVLLKMGRYVHHQRFGEVVGHVLPEFFGKVLTALSTTVNFSSNSTNYGSELAEKFGDVENDDDMLSFGTIEENNGTEKSSDEETSESPVEASSGEETGEAHIESSSNEETSEPPVEASSDEETSESPTEASSGEETSETPVEVSSDTGAKDSSAKADEKVSAEDYLTCIVSDALGSLDKTKSIEDSVDAFLDAIGMSNNGRITKSSFIAACVVKKIGYESIIIELHNSFPKMREEIIKATLKDEFKKWLAIHPDVKENYPKISIITLLKIFAKKMA